MTDLTILQGTDSGYSWPLFNPDGTPLNLTGYTVRSQARSFNGTLLYEWTTALGNATIVGNSVFLLWSHAVTSAWKWNNAQYDIEIVAPGGSVARIDRGTINISKEITR